MNAILGTVGAVVAGALAQKGVEIVFNKLGLAHQRAVVAQQSPDISMGDMNGMR